MLSHINISRGGDVLHLLIDKAVLYAVSLPGKKDRAFIFVTVFSLSRDFAFCEKPSDAR